MRNIKKDKKSTCSTKKKKLLHKHQFRGTQTEILQVEMESQIDTDKCLDAIITSDKYMVSNLMEMSDSSGTDSDND